MNRGISSSPAPQNARRTIRRVGIAGVAAIAFTLVAGAVARHAAHRSNPAPGTLVRVNGRQMHINCHGAGDTTVVLEAGLMDFSVLWTEVQSRISTFTRVCSYDRAGLGWSEGGTTARSSVAAAEELRQLLVNAGISPPYVLVGHSYGGLIATRYAQHHREHIAALVLVDGAHVDQLRRIPSLAAARTVMSRQFRSLHAMNRLGLLALMPKVIPSRGLTSDAARRYRGILGSSDYFRGATAELEAMETSFAPQSPDSHSLGDLPVVVVSRGLAEPLPHQSPEEQRQSEEEWEVLQRDLLTLSRRSVRLIAASSGHDIHVHQPALVANAIRSVFSPRPMPGPGDGIH